jgi:sec-independent protein translocase protein TatA
MNSEVSMIASSNLLAWMPGPGEMVIILIVALIFFGGRLPDVARSLGKSIVEFKRGLRDVQNEVERAGGEDQTKKIENQGPKSLPSERGSSPPAC